MASNEDDFWNQSSSSTSNFFNDDDDIAINETDSFATIQQENITLPIHSLISNKCFKIILDETDSIVEHVNPPVEDTIRRLFFGENVVLHTYRTLENKLQLLDSALDVGDGNIIITVILFLNKTLNSNLFYNELSKRKLAVKHYTNYLIEKNSFQELADLYMVTGNISSMKDVYYLLCKDNSNQDVLYKKVQQFMLHHSQNLHSNEDKSEIKENLNVLEFQIKNKFSNKSVIEHLTTLCTTEWEKKNGDNLINEFKKKFKVDEFQFEWVVMSVLCKMQNWDKLIETFIKSVWVLKKRALKSLIRSELFIIGLGRHNPPEHIMEQFLPCVGDVSKALYLAEKFKIHMFVVNHHVEQKDKFALLKYMERVDAAGPVMDAIQRSINNTEIKWKN